jgi:hypothetical protein
VVTSSSGFLAVLVDAVGYGPAAAAACRIAIDGILTRAGDPLVEICQAVHHELADTAGVSLAIARLGSGVGAREGRRAWLEYVGIGRVRGVLDLGEVIELPSRFGILGQGAFTRPASIRLPWRAGGTLLVGADGILNEWSWQGLGPFRGVRPGELLARLARSSAAWEDVTVLALRHALV